MSDKLPTYSPDATTENADWTKQSWDFPPYKSAEFLEAIGGPGALEKFRRSPAYAGAVTSGLIHDDEWLADWAEPSPPPEHGEPGAPRRNVHVHIHRRP